MESGQLGQHRICRHGMKPTCSEARDQIVSVERLRELFQLRWKQRLGQGGVSLARWSGAPLIDDSPPLPLHWSEERDIEWLCQVRAVRWETKERYPLLLARTHDSLRQVR